MMSDIARSNEKSFEFPASTTLVALRYQQADKTYETRKSASEKEFTKESYAVYFKVILIICAEYVEGWRLYFLELSSEETTRVQKVEK